MLIWSALLGMGASSSGGGTPFPHAFFLGAGASASGGLPGGTPFPLAFFFSFGASAPSSTGYLFFQLTTGPDAGKYLPPMKVG